MSLLPKDAFEHVFVPLRGRRVGLIDGVGNVGDRLIWKATRQLLRHFEIEWLETNPCDHWKTRLAAIEPLSQKVDVLLLFGGGTMGSFYPRPRSMMRNALATGKPCVVLPQSLMGREEGNFERVYVREHLSIKFCPAGILAPDLALGLEVDIPEILHKEPLGVFLRQDREKAVQGESLGDPTKMCGTLEEYVTLAAKYRRIVTDRLHFAIASMLCGNRTVLLPGSYHKNRGMWESWLGALGCEWAESVVSAQMPEARD